MSLIDSEAAFEKRCNELLDGLHDMMSHLQIVTFSALAFAVGTPQQAVTEQDMQRFCDRIVGGPASIAEVSIIKRLHFESQTLLMADVRRQASVGDSSEPTKSLPYVEKKRRLEAQQLRITGLSHMHEQKASHALIDYCFHIVETGALTYVAPSRCTSRDSEIQGEAKNKQKQLLTLEQGSLKAVANDGLSVVDVGTEMKLMYAFQRRGLAFDLVGLMSWDAHMEWVNKLFRAMMHEAPSNFQSVGLHQLLRADQEMFTLLASEYDGPLKSANVNLDPPLDAQVRMYSNDPRVTMHLVAMPKSEKRSAPAGGTHTPKQPPAKKQKNDAKPPAQLPSELHGLHTKTADGKPMARGRPIPGEDPDKGPQPLRSEAWPDGLPDLRPGERDRVNKANKCYAATAFLVRHLISLNISVSIENPKNSFFWLCSPIRSLLETYAHRHFSYFDHCMHGGKRDKSTAWWSWNPRNPDHDFFESLQLNCNKQHTHAPWRPYKDSAGQTIFPTAEEAAYPHLLCERVASILKLAAEHIGFVFPSDLQEQLNQVPHAAARQLFTAQPRGGRLRPLVSEYGHYLPILAQVDDDEAVSSFLKTLPKGSKICHRSLFPGGVDRDDMQVKFPNLQVTSAWKPDQPAELLHVGIPREPEDFLCEALRKGHPRDIIAQIPECVKPALDSLISGRTEDRFKVRAAFLKRWLKRSLELREDEQRLHDNLPDHLKSILRGKRLLLWKEILIDLKYPDSAVVDDIISGFALTGWAPSTVVFRKEVGEHDQYVWDETMNEVETGWLGPSSAEGECFIARRFPVPQKSKVRLVDDFSVAGVNGAYGLREKLRVQAVDELCAYLAAMLDSPDAARCPELVGRTYDLRAAYKQFGTDPWHADRLRIGVKNPAGGVGVFRALALPFGASGSVVHFLRISSSLTFIGVVALMLVWTSFFGDFTCLCCQDEEKNTSFYIESLFRLLGVDYADTGDKAVPFTPKFKTLGLMFDVSNVQSGSFSLEHTESRKTELAEALVDILKKGQTTNKDLERLHGRLIWFGSFIYGRLLNRLVKEVSNKSRGRTRKVVLDEPFRETLNDLLDAIRTSKPVSIGRSLCHTWIIFTDGAYEPESATPATFGGVLISPGGVPVECFGECIPNSFLQELLSESKHPIYELEVLPIVLACKLWVQHIAGSPTVFYLDNVAARASYIKGDGATRATRITLSEFVRMEARFRILSWFGRVPSHSNIADAPSRLDFAEPILAGCRRVRVVAPAHLKQWG
eukprot:s4229_g3.t1